MFVQPEERQLKGDPVRVFQNLKHSYRDDSSAFLMWVHSDGMTGKGGKILLRRKEKILHHENNYIF